MIRNLLFDLGGVIMDIKKERCIEAFDRIGLENAAAYFGEFSQQGPFMLVERGDIDIDEFHRRLHTLLPDTVTDADIDAAFCQFLTGIPTHRLKALRELRRRYKVYLLSNTNPVMWNSLIREEFTHEELTREDYFDGMVTSFQAGALKPDARIFRYAIDTLGIDPDETLFVDDSQTNLDAAAALGFHTALVAPPAEMSEVLGRVLTSNV